MRTLLAAFIIALVSLSTLTAQTDAEKHKAYDLAMEGIKATDEGDLDRGLELLTKAAAIDPANVGYRYEQGYVYVKKEDYKRALEILEPLLADEANASQVEDVWYQLIANCHDYLGETEKAMDVYKAGLKRFPKSGPLHLELGVMAMKENDYDKAIGVWEEGIRVAPKFPSNYYWASRLFCKSSEPMWGLIYGEVFLLLEPNSRRTGEISKLMFDTYNKAITIGKDSVHVELSSGTIVPKRSGGEFVMPFSVDYELCMTLSTTPTVISRKDAPGNGSLSIADLNDIRSTFVKHWFDDTLGRRHPVALFEYQRRLRDAGLFEVYNYWLLSAGVEAEASEWLQKHQDQFREFVGWLRKNPIPMTPENAIDRRNL